jgi:hypothetical protein
MNQKTIDIYKKIIRLLGSLLFGATASHLFLTSSLSQSQFLAAITMETLRGVGMALLGPFFSLGMALGDVYTQWVTPCESITVFERLTILLPHLALGWLWGQFNWKGGVLSLVIALLWHWGLAEPKVWFFPAFGFVAIYILIFRQIILQPQSLGRKFHESFH